MPPVSRQAIAALLGMTFVTGLIDAQACDRPGRTDGVVRALGVPDLTTTVLTLTVTGIAADSSLAGGANPRLGRRLLAISTMLAEAAAVMLLLQSLRRAEV